ncbi:unnamed protein product [Choristocarpus tenellus]
MDENKRDVSGEANELLQFLLTAKAALDEDEYTSFVCLLNSYHARMTDTDDLIQGASTLLSTHPHLHVGLKKIAPESHHPRIDDLIKTAELTGLQNKAINSPSLLDCGSGWNNLPCGSEKLVMQDPLCAMLDKDSVRLEPELIGGGSTGIEMGTSTLDMSGQGGGMSSSKNQFCLALKSYLEPQSLPPPGGGTGSPRDIIGEPEVPDSSNVLHGQGPPNDDESIRGSPLNSLFEAIMTDYTQDGVHSEPLTHLEYPQQTKAKPLSPHLHQDPIPPQNNNLQVMDSDAPHTTQMLPGIPLRSKSGTWDASTHSPIVHLPNSSTGPSDLCEPPNKYAGVSQGSGTGGVSTGACGNLRDKASTASTTSFVAGQLFPTSSFPVKRRVGNVLGEEYGTLNYMQRPEKQRPRPSWDRTAKTGSGNQYSPQVGTVAGERVRNVLTLNADLDSVDKVGKSVCESTPIFPESSAVTVGSEETTQAFHNKIRQKYMLLLEDKDREIARLKVAAARWRATDRDLCFMLKQLREENKRLMDRVGAGKYSELRHEKERSTQTVSPSVVF